MKEIRKYTLDPSHGGIGYSIPAGSELLHIGSEGGIAAIWFLIDTSRPATSHEFFVAHERCSIPNWCCRSTHRGTVETMNARGYKTVLHVFERSLGDW